VIEAVPEDLALKHTIFRELSTICPPETILATNTSALSITEIAAAASDPSRVVGMHYFNPAHVMKLVEIVRGLETADRAVDVVESAAKRCGKETVLINEAPGFATSRINAMIGNEAFYMLMEGVASARDIDKALKLGLNHPMGPFEMIDLVGLDTRRSARSSGRVRCSSSTSRRGASGARSAAACTTTRTANSGFEPLDR